MFILGYVLELDLVVGRS